ncbi:hypothetical protein HN801_04440, partial [Candidatus Peregrinibacteria bacterium]|nr:hypothetical protein [Candidatus Peregrinibacteria bacterium]
MISPLSHTRLKGLLLLVIVGSTVSLIVTSMNGSFFRGAVLPYIDCSDVLTDQGGTCPEGYSQTGQNCAAVAGIMCTAGNCEMAECQDNGSGELRCECLIEACEPGVR